MESRIRLHLGCFDQPVEGWNNTDVTPHIAIARIPGAAAFLHRIGVIGSARYEQHRAGVFRRVSYLNLSRRFPFRDNSVDAIFSTHVLEHLPDAIAMNCLKECARVIRPGGVLRCGVPDLDIWVTRYDPQEPNLFVEGVFETRQRGGKNRHYWMYNERSLIDAMLEAGFTKASRRDYLSGDCPDLDRLDNRPSETLFVEGIK